MKKIITKSLRVVSILFWISFSILTCILSILYLSQEKYLEYILSITVCFTASILGYKLTILKEPKDNKIIKIVYHTNTIDKIKKIAQGDWIDLRAAEDVILKKGEFKLISLGISMKLPDGYEAHVVPRSSTYKNFKIIQTNSIGIIDNSYSGTNDIWKFPALATEDTIIHKNDRICQFRVVPIQQEIHFVETNELDNVGRGGFGSTGKQ